MVVFPTAGGPSIHILIGCNQKIATGKVSLITNQKMSSFFVLSYDIGNIFC